MAANGRIRAAGAMLPEAPIKHPLIPTVPPIHKIGVVFPLAPAAAEQTTAHPNRLKYMMRLNTLRAVPSPSLPSPEKPNAPNTSEKRLKQEESRSSRETAMNLPKTTAR